MQIMYPKPKELYVRVSEGGALIEGRQYRKGFGSMKASTYCKKHVITNLTFNNKAVPELPNQNILELSYLVDVDTFTPLAILGDINRYDTLSAWLLSWQEELLHKAKGTTFIKSQLWTNIMGIANSERERIRDVFIQWLEVVINQGDTGFEQFKFYVHEHKDSASPFQGYWGDIEKDPIKLKEAYVATKKFLFEFLEFMKDLKDFNEIMIRANYAYPGVRARPGDATVIKRLDYSLRVLIQKWRDRKVGGIKGISQLGFPIYMHESHKKADAVIHNYIRKLLPGVECHSLSDEGPKLYLEIMTWNGFMFDIKTAEVQIALAMPWLGFGCDLGIPEFIKEVAQELYSGVGPTTPCNEIFQAIVLKAIQEVFNVLPKRWAYFSDNMFIDIDLPETIHLDKAERWTGFIVPKGRFGPVSLCTDNPSHRIGFKGKSQTQIQTYQYIMRPLASCVMNGIFDPNSPRKFLEFVVQNDLYKKSPQETYRNDDMKQALFENVDVHQKFRDVFVEDEKNVKMWFPVQTTDPDFATDLRID